MTWRLITYKGSVKEHDDVWQCTKCGEVMHFYGWERKRRCGCEAELDESQPQRGEL